MDAPTDSLYDRLGGIYSIAKVVDDFIDRIMVDERLNSNPRVDEAHHRVLPPDSNISLRRCSPKRPEVHSTTRVEPWWKAIESCR